MATAKKRGKSWRVKVYDYTDTNGAKHYKSFTAETKREAEMMAAEYKAGKKRTQKLTLREAMKKYIEIKTPVLSPTTIDGYNNISRNHLQSIMDVYTTELTPALLQGAISAEAQKYSPKTVRNVNALLSAVLEMYAPDSKAKLQLPQPKKKDIVIPDTNEIKTMIAATEEDKELQLAIMLASMGPLRLSEVCALTKEDIHGKTIKISKAKVITSDGWKIKQPKTVKGNRTIEYPSYVIEAAQSVEGNSLISVSPHAIYKRYKHMLSRAGLPSYTFHALRHYGASLLMSQGFPIDYIMERGGWESRDVLERIYTHTMDSVRTQLNDKLMKALEDLK